ncbi:MAG: phosphatase PAP2 family protein [Candidatus Goldiibacteriota bacterium]
MIRKKILSYSFYILIPVVFSVPFWVFNIDIELQKMLYRDGRWVLGSDPAVKFLYKYGTLPGIFLGIGAVIAFILSFFCSGFAGHRKKAVIIIIASVLGPILFVNAVFKSYYGRPRPREVKELGGNREFKPVLVPGRPGEGNSFPSGHASAGFMLMSLYFALGRRRSKTAVFMLAAGGVYGTMIGAARMAQGGHFASDVLWAGVFVVLASRIARDVSGSFLSFFEKRSKGGRTAAFAAGLFLLSAAAAAFLLSKPYHGQGSYKSACAGDKEYIFDLNAEEADIIFTGSNDGYILVEAEADGFGAGSSEFKDSFKSECGKQGFLKAEYEFGKKGFFAEFSAVIKVYLPDGVRGAVNVKTGRGIIKIRKGTVPEKINVVSGSGNIYFEPDSAAEIKTAELKTEKGNIRFAPGPDTGFAENAVIRLNAAKGHVFFASRGAAFREIDGKHEGAKELKFISTVKDGPGMYIYSGKGLKVKEKK